RLDLAEPLPGQVGLGQGGLEQVLGGGPVAREEVRRAQQRGGAGRDELAELLLHRGPGRHRRRLPVLTRRKAGTTTVRLSQPVHGFYNDHDRRPYGYPRFGRQEPSSALSSALFVLDSRA